MLHTPVLRRDNDITGVLDHTFCVEHNAYGEIIQHELKPNGKSVPVTEDTKKEYVRYEGGRGKTKEKDVKAACNQQLAT